MKKVKIFILFIVVGLSACNSADKKTVDTNTDSVSKMKIATDSNVITAAIDSSHNAKNSLDWQGEYIGVLPCADCDGLKTSITISKDGTYKISEEYLGKKELKETKYQGKFTGLDGSSIQLVGIVNAPSKYFVTEGRMIQLDMKGKRIEGALADKYVLVKQH